MSTITDMKKLFHGVRRGVPRTEYLIHPERDWLVGLAASVLLFVGGALYLGFDFLVQYESVDVRPVVDETVVRYRAVDAAHDLNEYRDRDAIFRSLRADRSHADIMEEAVPPPTPETGGEPASADSLAEEGVEQ